MRHGKKINHLSRKAPHRKAMLSNMACSLIKHKRITTTVAKAKALRKYVEPLITKSKTDTTHSRRTVFSYLQDKDAVRILFDEVADKIADRPGGYTRVIRTGFRLGDNAETCLIELVDYNEFLQKDTKDTKSKSRRSRRGKKKSSSVAEVTEVIEEVKTEATEQVEEVTEQIEEVEQAEVVEDVKEETEEVVEEINEVKDELPTEEAEKKENTDESDDEEKPKSEG